MDTQEAERDGEPQRVDNVLGDLDEHDAERGHGVVPHLLEAGVERAPDARDAALACEKARQRQQRNDDRERSDPEGDAQHHPGQTVAGDPRANDTDERDDRGAAERRDEIGAVHGGTRAYTVCRAPHAYSGAGTRCPPARG